MRRGALHARGVQFHFIAPQAGSLARNPRFATLLRTLDVDALHVHGLCFPRDVLALRALAPHTPLLLQDHAERVPRLWRRRLWKRGAALADGIAFCARAQAEPFARRGLIAPHTAIFEIPESTARFSPAEQSAARAATGVQGNPALLWVGHLDPNKDPLTVLEGVAAATLQLPGLTLWMCYGNAPLLGAVAAKIREPRLHGRVHLLGRVPHERVQQLMHAADLFVLGSNFEGSGYSVIEALACGLTPVVTDIPSFRVLVGSGAEAAGALWPCGNAAALGVALVASAAHPAATRRARALARFDQEISSAALGRKLRDAYLQMLADCGARRRVA